MRSLIYILKESSKNLWRNKSMSFVTIMSLTATLAILGIVFVLILNINMIIIKSQDEFNEVVAYVEDDVTKIRLDQIKQELKSIIGVKSVKFLSKSEALADWKEEWGKNAYLLDALEENPLPDQFIVELKDIKFATSVVEIIKKFEDISRVDYEEEIIQKIIILSEGIRKFAFFIVLILICITIFIVSNTIKINLFSREREINIMKFVGATNWFIRWPFVFEGIFMGFISGMLSTGIIYFVYSKYIDYASSNALSFITIRLLSPKDISIDLFQIFSVIGICVGAIGAINAIKYHLKV